MLISCARHWHHCKGITKHWRSSNSHWNRVTTFCLWRRRRSFGHLEHVICLLTQFSVFYSFSHKLFWSTILFASLLRKWCCQIFHVLLKIILILTEMAYNTMDPKHGFDCVKHIVQQHPYSITAWNCYYKVISRYWILVVYLLLYDFLLRNRFFLSLPS